MSPVTVTKVIGILLVIVGTFLQLMGIALGNAWFISGMTASALGLWLYAKAKRKPWYVALTALIPVLGPLVALAAYEREDSKSSAFFLKARERLTRWGLVIAGLGLLVLLVVSLIKLPCTAEGALWLAGILSAVFGGLMVILLRPAYLVLLAALGILSAISIPGFMSYQARARQGDAKAELGRVFDVATSGKTVHGAYDVPDIAKLSQGRAYRYAIWYAVNGSPTRLYVPAGVRCEPCLETPPTSVKVAVSVTGFTAAAKGNIDGDATCDEWSINDAKELKNTLNDVMER